MENLSYFLSRCLVVFLLVACFDGQYSLSDDFPSLIKHFFIKVEACIEGMTDIHPYIPQYDELNGLAVTLGRLWCTTGHSNSLCSERLRLNAQTRVKS